MLILIKYKKVHTEEGRQPRRQMGLKIYNMCVHFCMLRVVVALICVQQTKLEYHSWELEPFGPQQCWLAVTELTNFPPTCITTLRLPLWHSESTTHVELTAFLS